MREIFAQRDSRVCVSNTQFTPTIQCSPTMLGSATAQDSPATQGSMPTQGSATAQGSATMHHSPTAQGSPTTQSVVNTQCAAAEDLSMKLGKCRASMESRRLTIVKVARVTLSCSLTIDEVVERYRAAGGS
ncbi:unnamed protein product [Tuber aestivum]|uniref:Uncharacterized protein n=1 Tax=Tuber aestivum TaxID=59557 RepID=A0A292QA37_9PEZI|nr:unnamed protein product [Tuber aestivum]